MAMDVLDHYLYALASQHFLSETGHIRELSDIYLFVWNSIEPQVLKHMGYPEDHALERLENLLSYCGLADRLRQWFNEGTLEKGIQRHMTYRRQLVGGARYITFLYVDMPWHVGWLVNCEDLLFDGPSLGSPSELTLTPTSTRPRGNSHSQTTCLVY